MTDTLAVPKPQAGDLGPSLSRLECFAFDITPKNGSYVMSHGRELRSFTSTVVRIETADGIQGVGEACLLGANYGYGFAGSTRAAIAELAPWVLTQNPLDVDRIVDGMDKLMLGHFPAKSAIDAALWDLRGKLLKQPVVRLLGGLQQQEMGVFQAISLADPAAMAAEIKDVATSGIRKWQLKLGDDPITDAERTRAASAALPTDSTFLTSDANCGWTRAQALRFARALDGIDTYLEQPCRTMEEVAQVKARTSLPIMLDECIITVADLVRAISLGIVDAVNLKPTRVGGLTKASRIRDVAQACGLMILVDESQGGALATAGMAHLAATIAPANLLGVSYFCPAGEHILQNGAVSVDSTTPGLGAGFCVEELGEPLFVIEGKNA
jgi:cis-L-3-hydroxyproline dehydratase